MCISAHNLHESDFARLISIRHAMKALDRGQYGLCTFAQRDASPCTTLDLKEWKRVALRKKLMVLGSCFIGFVFLCGFQEPDKQANPCLQSTCRDVPLRENLSAIGPK